MKMVFFMRQNKLHHPDTLKPIYIMLHHMFVTGLACVHFVCYKQSKLALLFAGLQSRPCCMLHLQNTTVCIDCAHCICAMIALDIKSRIQVVINNAGVYGPKGLTLDSVKSEDMAFTFQTNAIGPLLVVQQLLRHKLIGKPGSIIGNVTSKVICVLLPHLCLHLAFGLGQAVSVQMVAAAGKEVSCFRHVTVEMCQLRYAIVALHVAFLLC